MPLTHFHPAVRDWFSRSFTAPTPAQLQAWAAIRSGAHTLVAAPTGSGKTLAAFLCAIDALVQRASTGQLLQPGLGGSRRTGWHRAAVFRGGDQGKPAPG